MKQEKFVENKNMYEFTIGHDKTKIKYKIEFIGNDVDITITGGKRHIGSLVMISNNSYNLLNVPNHREDELLMPFIAKLRKYDKGTIVIKAGFHIDDIILNEIDMVMENNTKAVEKIIDYLNSS